MILATHRRLIAGGLLLGYLTLTALFAHLGYLNHLDNRIKGIDGCYYYIYLRSVMFDGDIDFNNEVTHYYGPKRAEQTRTASGKVGNHWSIGPALFWAPFFGAAHGATLIANAIGWQLPSDGYSGLYALFVYIGNSLYGLAGFFFLAAAMRRHFDLPSTLLASLTVMLASSLTYYFWPFTTMPHAVSFFAVSVFIWLVLRFGMGWQVAVGAGLMFLARWQDIIYAIVLLPLVCCRLIEDVRRGGFRPTRWLIRHAALGALFLMVVSPQLIVWKILYGNWIMAPATAQKIDFANLHLFEVFFGTANGLLSWHPLLALGFVGIGLLSQKDRILSAGLAFGLLAQVIFVSSLQSSWGWSFGSRFMVGALPLLAFGLAACFEKMLRYRVGAVVAVSMLIGFGVWNQLFIFQYQKGLIPRGKALNRQELFQDKWRIGDVAAAESLYRQARAALGGKDFENGLRLARQAEALTGGKEKILLLRAICDFFARHFDASRQSFERLALLDPQEMTYRLGLSYAYQALGDPTQALAAVAADDDPDARWVRQFQTPGRFQFHPNFFQRLFKKLASFDGI